MKINRYILIAVTVLLVFPLDKTSSQAWASGLGVGIGYYNCFDVPTYPWGEGPWEFVVDRKPTYGIELYFQDILDVQAKYRTGVKFFLNNANSNPRHPEEVSYAMQEGLKYQLRCFLATCQYKVYGGASIPILIDMSAGVAYRVDNTQSDCRSYVTHGGFVLQPGVVIIPRLRDHLGLEIGVHTMLGMAWEDMYPFSSGAHLQISLLFEPERNRQTGSRSINP